MDVRVQRVVERYQLGRVTNQPGPPLLAEGVVQAVLRLGPTVVDARVLTRDRRVLHPLDSIVASELREDIVIMVRYFVRNVGETCLRLGDDVLHHFRDAHDPRERGGLANLCFPLLFAPLVLLDTALLGVRIGIVE